MTPRLKHYSFWQTGHCHPFSTWQAGQTRKGFANWQAVSGWLFTTLQAVYRSGSAPISAPARWEHIPNPKIAQVRAARFLTLS